MDNNTASIPAAEPEDLGRLFVERASAWDLDGLVALYEPTAVLAVSAGGPARGHASIRRAYERLLAVRSSFLPGEQSPALRFGDDLALTSTRLVDGGATAEVARRQPDGTWLWILDRPNVLTG